MVGADGALQGLDGTKYTMRSDGKLVSEGKKVFKSTGKVVTADQRVMTGVSAFSLDESGQVISADGAVLTAGAKIVIHQVGIMFFFAPLLPQPHPPPSTPLPPSEENGLTALMLFHSYTLSSLITH